MRLTELDPHWYSSDHGARIGLSFRCPIHRNHRLAVAFVNPIGEGDAHADSLHWLRVGETFEDITLTPSIDASQHGCWHGYITNGGVSV